MDWKNSNIFCRFCNSKTYVYEIVTGNLQTIPSKTTGAFRVYIKPNKSSKETNTTTKNMHSFPSKQKTQQRISFSGIPNSMFISQFFRPNFSRS